MSQDRWQDLTQLFDRLVGLEPEEQAASIEEIRSVDRQLADELTALLRSSRASTRLIHDAVGEAASDLASAIRTGERIGPYRLLRELGRGGMGAVYLAERADGQFEQQAAIKLLPAGALDPMLLERFQTERQILAQLDHPHIARLLDGGTTGAGVPYFVMEHVQGEPIDVFCDRERLSIRDRLELFTKVCAAVESAHRQLVIHRDLKPSNILITADGVPKLLDFGIAKIVEPGETSAVAGITRAGERLMTPEYASPEQVRAEPVSTATDVYALGLLLYELLTGHRAHRLSSQAPQEVQRVVCETPPTRPSAVVTRDVPGTDDADTRPRQTCEEIGRARAMAPLKLKKRLAGDLDNIVLKALRKEPERRFGSVAELSQDVRRHLEGLPVVAHADSRAYRTRKFVRRHLLPLAALSGGLLLVAGLMIFYTVRLFHERDRAQVEAEKATQVSEFLRGLFEVANPNETGGEEVTARQLLDAGARRVQEQLQRQPEVQAEMMDLIGSIYIGLAMYEPARPLLERALVIRRERHGEGTLPTAESHRHLGLLEQRVSELATAEGHYRQALEIVEEQAGAGSLAAATALVDLAGVLELQNRFLEAESLLKRALPLIEKSSGREDPRYAATLGVLGEIYWQSGAQQEGEEIFRRVLEIRQEILDPDDIALAESLRRYGKAIQARGAYAEAEPYYRHALAIQEQVLGPDHPDTGETVNSLGTLFFHLEQYEKAEPLFRRHLEIFTKALGPKGNRTAIALGNLADCLMMQGRYEEAEPLFRRAIAVFEEGPYRQNVAWGLRELSGALVRQGRLGEARSALERAISIRIEEFGGDEPDLAPYLSELGDVHREAGRPAAALEVFERALALQEKHLDPSHIELARTRAKLGQLHAAAGRCTEARAVSLQALEVLSTQVPEGHELRDLAAKSLALCGSA